MSEMAVLVIGGGVAGSACALRLRQRGIEVTVAEQAVFPREKVCGCCIGGAGLDWLDTLSQLDWVVAHAVRTRRWISSLGGRVVEIKLPRGVAVSRQTLDTRLIAEAESAGATVMTPCVASIAEVADNGVTVELADLQGRHRPGFAAVVVAGGLNVRGLNRILPWIQSPHGPFGVSYHVDCRSLETGVIFMACDDDGYVGLVRLETGRVDIAAALRSGSGAASRGTPIQRVESILRRSRLPSWDFEDPSPVMTTPPLRRTRRAGSGRVLAIGDAAGYVEPFTGEGMAWAMQSAIAAADIIADSARDLSQVGDDWDRRLRRLLWRKKLTCRAVTTTLRSPRARRAVAGALARYPHLAAPLIRSLGRA